MGFLLGLDYCCLTKTCQRSLINCDGKNLSCVKISDCKECDCMKGAIDAGMITKQEEFCRNCSVSVHSNEDESHHYLKKTLTNINAKLHPTRKLSLVKNYLDAPNMVAGVKYSSTSDSEDESTHK